MLNKELKREKLYDIIVRNSHQADPNFAQGMNALKQKIDGAMAWFEEIDKLVDDGKPIILTTTQ
jgi:hypothetical protein